MAIKISFVLFLLVGLCFPFAESGAQIRPLSSSGVHSLVLVEDSLWAVDAMTLTAHNAGRPSWMDSFEETTLPFVNSSTWDSKNAVFWLWDYSVGSTIKLSFSGETIDFNPRRSSHIQYEHAGGLHPIDRTPIAYGGYGYYRAKKFMLSFSPEADTWLEVPFSGQIPASRMGAIMLSNIDSTRVVIAGGRTADSRAYPPVYNQDAEEAWAFDFATHLWEKLPYEPWLDCGLDFTRSQLGDIPVQDDLALLFWPESCALPFRTDRQLNNAIVGWQPFSGVVTLLGVVENLPMPFRLSGLYLNDDNHPEVVVAQDESDKWSKSLRRADVVLVESYEENLQRPKKWSLWWLILPTSLLMAAALGARAFTRITVTVDSSSGVVVFKKGFTRLVTSPSASVVQLVKVIASSPSSARISGDLVSQHFDSFIYDMDAARVGKNRAINDLNELSLSLGLGTLIERERSTSDRRKFDFRSKAVFKERHG